MASELYFSIIVVCLNAGNLITNTIESIQKQSYKNYEVIIKDGLSKDNTLSKIPKNDEQFKVVSCKDTGIYNAMNQSIQVAKGKYLYFLNCGDILFKDDILQNVYELTANLEGSKRIVYGDVHRDGLTYNQPEEMYDFYLYRTSINHQSMFFGKDVFDSIGGYREEFKAAADYEIEVKAFRSKKIEFIHLDIEVCEYLSGGYSDTVKGKKQVKKDFKIIHKENFSKSEIFKYEFIQIASLKWLRRIIDSDKSPQWIRKPYRSLMNLINEKRK
jgi:glycosyltransferase involved in cell wall biosynthesis